jgi:excisionase family DNA binding protein
MKGGVERGTVREAAKILGLKVRKIQAMSQRGELPGAAKIRRQWTYNLAKLRGFIRQQERATQCQSNESPRPDATGGEIFSGAALRSAGSASGGRLRQMIQQSQKRVAKLAESGQ